jgi:Sigma-70 region 2
MGTSPTEAMAEADLVRDARQGVPQSFLVIYHCHRSPVFQFAWRLTGSQTAEDVTQECFLALMRGPAFDGDRVEITSGTNILTQSGKGALWVYHNLTINRMWPVCSPPILLTGCCRRGEGIAPANDHAFTAALTWQWSATQSRERTDPNKTPMLTRVGREPSICQVVFFTLLECDRGAGQTESDHSTDGLPNGTPRSAKTCSTLASHLYMRTRRTGSRSLPDDTNAQKRIHSEVSNSRTLIRPDVRLNSTSF